MTFWTCQYTVQDVLDYQRNTLSSKHSLPIHSTIQEALQQMDLHNLTTLPISHHHDTQVSIQDLLDFIVHFPTLANEVQFQLLSLHPSGKSTVLDLPLADVLAHTPQHLSPQIESTQSLTELLHLLVDSPQQQVSTTTNKGQVVTGFDVLKFIQHHNDQIPHPVLDMALGQLPLTQKQQQAHDHPAEISIHETALHALKQLDSIHVGALPVVDGEGKLVTALAASSIRRLTHRNLSLLGKPVLAYLYGTHLEFPYLVQDNFLLSQVMSGMAQMNTQRAWLVTPRQQFERKIEVKDILYIILHHSQ